MIKIKVVGGTAKSNENLCTSCKHSHITEDEGGETLTLCDRGKTRRVLKRVHTCNRYSNVEDLDMYELEKIAWILRTDKFGKHIGFKPYKKLNSDEQEKVDEDLELHDW